MASHFLEGYTAGDTWRMMDKSCSLRASSLQVVEGAQNRRDDIHSNEFTRGVQKPLRVGPFRMKIGASGAEFREESGGDGPGAIWAQNDAFHTNFKILRNRISKFQKLKISNFVKHQKRCFLRKR